MNARVNNSQQRDQFRSFRDSSFHSGALRRLMTAEAVENIVAALIGTNLKLTEREIRRTLGHPKSPNEASIALRTRVPRGWFK